MRHYEEKILIPAGPEQVFDRIDNHADFSSHMNKPSWMMGGGKMEAVTDAGGGRAVGSHIRLSGKAFGLPLYLDEVVTQYEPGRLKAWETVGTPKLLVVGPYRMKIAIAPDAAGSLLSISIDYDLPQANAWLGRLFGAAYAKWCVKQMVKTVKTRFKIHRE